MEGGVKYFLEGYKEPTILLASLAMMQIYKFHLMSAVNFSPNRHLKPGASLRVQSLTRSGVLNDTSLFFPLWAVKARLVVIYISFGGGAPINLILSAYIFTKDLKMFFYIFKSCYL